MPGKMKVRDRIMHVAADLFYRQGYHQTGINQIIAEADIAIGSLYNHFPSKNDLLMAYLERKEAEFFEELAAFSASADSPRERILRYVDFRIDQQKKFNFNGCPFTNIISEVGTHDPELRKVVEENKKRHYSWLLPLFKQAKCEDLWDKKLLAESFFLMTEGANVNSTVTRSVQPLEQIKKFIKKVVS
ncbi:TetR/AcrR family transcriptional regulator [Chitinophaga vietnamensis]|uniref:TetR/AcrR family transcriptional regulator n=1 Tax=Chitinophaga vietnamensis TaxID=2593957 RepID=UPI001178988B|nr:TetR/AcrR family transcriptional regulator [Chitinophaga vietnamensis]